jgi:hypothetical protein
MPLDEPQRGTLSTLNPSARRLPRGRDRSANLLADDLVGSPLGDHPEVAVYGL